MASERYEVLAHKNQASRFYRVGATLYSGTDRSAADRYYLDSPKSRDEVVCLYVFSDQHPAGKETSSRW